MGPLYERLQDYHGKDIYPFHMPGHKRNQQAVDFLPGLTEDITEIEGFDYLHGPAGILKESQEAAARLYGADETYYCVNGSTGALLAAIGACTTPGGTLLMARNCHQSVYHGVCLNHLDNCYVYPQVLAPYGLGGAISPGQVEEALAARPDVQAVVITSPTYDGIVSPVAEIAETVHCCNLPLIVDEAHGAHFPFHPYFPDSALGQGADVVVHSLHKTLPSLTQTALLHVKGERADRERIRRYMAMYQTSSPSYLLMGEHGRLHPESAAGGDSLFEAYVGRLRRLRERLSGLRHIRLIGDGLQGGCAAWDFDRSKLILGTGTSRLSGHQLYRQLLERYGLQMEMEAETYVLGMTSVADTEEGYGRLCRALEDMEKAWEGSGQGQRQEEISGRRREVRLEPGERVLPLHEAILYPHREILLAQSEGHVAADFLYLYPPGIPLAVPGERITPWLIGTVTRCLEEGLEVRGIGKDGQGARICNVLTKGP